MGYISDVCILGTKESLKELAARADARYAEAKGKTVGEIDHEKEWSPRRVMRESRAQCMGGEAVALWFDCVKWGGFEPESSIELEAFHMAGEGRDIEFVRVGEEEDDIERFGEMSGARHLGTRTVIEIWD